MGILSKIEKELKVSGSPSSWEDYGKLALTGLLKIAAKELNDKSHEALAKFVHKRLGKTSPGQLHLDAKMKFDELKIASNGGDSHSKILLREIEAIKDHATAIINCISFINSTVNDLHTDFLTKKKKDDLDDDSGTSGFQCVYEDQNHMPLDPSSIITKSVDR